VYVLGTRIATVRVVRSTYVQRAAVLERSTHAAELRTEGVDIGIVSKQLGHRSISTTAHYLDHIAPHSVLAAIQKRCWASPFEPRR
jgi:integrase